MSAMLHVHWNKSPNIINYNVKKLLPWEGAVNNEPAVENNKPTKCTTANKQLTKCAAIQKMGSSSTTTITNSSRNPPKDITISSSLNPITPTMSTSSQAKSNDLLSLKSLWECTNIKRVSEPKSLLSMMESGYCKKFLSSRSHVSPYFENSPQFDPCKGISSVSYIFLMNLTN